MITNNSIILLTKNLIKIKINLNIQKLMSLKKITNNNFN